MTGFNLSVVEMRRVIKAVAPAASTDEARPILCGVVVELDKDGIASFTASDSYRVHRATLAAPIEAAPFRALIPAAWLQRWSKVPWPRASWVSLRVRAPRSQPADASRHARVQLDVDGDRISTGTIAEDVDKQGYHFPDIDSLYALTGADEGASAFHPKYLRAVFDAAHVWSALHPVRTPALNALKPCRFTVIDPTVGTLDMLLMPVRIPPAKGEEA